jgi:hypothetical protein
VLDAAGITPEEDLKEQEETSAKEPTRPAGLSSPTSAPSETNEERLSVYEDFLQNLDINLKPPSEDEDDENPDLEDKPDQK